MKLYLCECRCRRETTPTKCIYISDYCAYNGGIDCKVNPITDKDNCEGCGVNEDLTRGMLGQLFCGACREAGQREYYRWESSRKGGES